MRVKVVMFAVARDLIGEKAVELDLAAPATIQDLKKALVVQFPSLKDVVQRSAFSVNHEYAIDNCQLTENAEIALIPPVSGG